MSAATQQTGRYRMRFCAACGTVFTFDNRNARRDRRTLCPECRLSVGNQERKEKSFGIRTRKSAWQNLKKHKKSLVTIIFFPNKGDARFYS